MKKTIFITGPVRSGKSRFAVQIAKKTGSKVTFIATCAPGDAEMAARVRRHRAARPKAWRTVEEGIDLAAALRKARRQDTVIIDCLTLWVSNLLLKRSTEEEVAGRARGLAAALRRRRSATIIVSNEVGWGIVPDNRMSRVFRDTAGRVHQVVAEASDEVYLVAAGIPLKMKG